MWRRRLARGVVRFTLGPNSDCFVRHTFGQSVELATEEEHLTEKPEVTDEHRAKAKEMRKACEEDGPTVVMPGTDGAVWGTAAGDEPDLNAARTSSRADPGTCWQPDLRNAIEQRPSADQVLQRSLEPEGQSTTTGQNSGQPVFSSSMDGVDSRLIT